MRLRPPTRARPGTFLVGLDITTSEFEDWISPANTSYIPFDNSTMALRMLPSTMSLQMIPRLLSFSPATGQWSRFFQSSSVLTQTLFRPVGLSLTIPGLLSDIWDSVLRAVPKKKVSHMKRRHRQMAGKALKDVKNLNTCSGCGQVKRAHVLCPHCVAGMTLLWKNRMFHSA